jgi:transcription initiation factor TFIID subunit 10
MSDFFSALDTYTPTVPDEVTQYHLLKSGVNVKDPRITKLVSLAADKFLAEIIYEAKQLSLLRMKNSKYKGKRKLEDMSETFEMEDLCRSLEKKKISISARRHEAVIE